MKMLCLMSLRFLTPSIKKPSFPCIRTLMHYTEREIPAANDTITTIAFISFDDYKFVDERRAQIFYHAMLLPENNTFDGDDLVHRELKK